MITQAKCKKVIDQAVAYAKGRCDGIEVIVSASDTATSRFANNEMTQNQSPYAVSVSVRAIVGQRQARLNTDQISAAGVRNLVDNAIRITWLLEDDPEILPLYAPAANPRPAAINRYDSKTAKVSAAERAYAVEQIIDVAKANGFNASGVVSTGSSVFAIGNSAGLFEFHRETEAECSITMTGANSSGWAKANRISVGSLDAAKLATIAAEKALASANPSEIDPGRYTVILEPSAVLDLLGFLWGDFTGTSHTDKLSCFLNKVGKKTLGGNITVVDDVTQPLQAGAPFDGEGLPRKTVTLVENGLIKNLVHGRRSAKKFGVQPTGHGVVEPSAMGEYPVNIVVSGGSSSLDELIRSCDKAILLTRVWYVREVDPTLKIVTGMTRDGTFLVENGVIKSGLKNLRFNVSLLDMLNNVAAMSPAERAAGEEAMPAVVPAMKVDNFNFASGTRF